MLKRPTKPDPDKLYFLSVKENIPDDSDIELSANINSDELVISDVSQALEVRANVPLKQANNKPKPVRYDVQDLLSEEAESESKSCMSQSKITGTEWLKEIHEMSTINGNSFYLNNTTADETMIIDENVNKKANTIPSTAFIAVNSSNKYLNDGDIKKRKTKFYKYLSNILKL